MRVETKNDGELKHHQARYETLALWSGVAVVAGLALEVWLAIEFRPEGQGLIQTWGPVGADVLVAVGVFFEILFGRWALHQGSELQRRATIALENATDRAEKAVDRAAQADLKAAEANERAGKLEKEAAEARERTAQLERSIAGRRISDEQANKMAAFLSDKPQLCLRIIAGTDDPEVRRFGGDIAHVFRRCGWKVQFLAVTPVANFDGMHIPIYGPPNLPACDLVRAAISAAGIEFRGGAPSFGAGMMVASGDNISGPCADMHLGAKPPPNIG